MQERPLLHLLVPRWGGVGIYQTFGHRFPPMSLLVLAAHARRCGWDVEVIDLNYEPSPLDSVDWDGPRTRIGKRRRSGRPDLAALTVWTPNAPNAYRTADAYRRRGVPVVLGGVHASLLPGEALRHADAVVCGEADQIRQAYRWFYRARRRYARFGRHILDRDPRFNMAFAACNRNYDRRYRKLDLDDMPAFHADPGDVARMALASAAPAQEALNVAFAQVSPNVALLGRKPTSTAT